MDKTKKLADLILSNNLSECKELLDDIIKEKISESLDNYELKESIFKFRKNKIKSELKRALKRNSNNMSDDVVQKAVTRFIKKKQNPIYIAREDVNTAFNEEKHPHTIKVSDAFKILKQAGYKMIRSGGKHQTYWRHETDTNKPDFALPDHSRDVSPGLTRQLYKLLPENEIIDLLSINEEIKGYKLDYTYSKGNKASKVYRSPNNNFMTTFHQNGKKLNHMTTQHGDDEEGAHDLAKYWTEKQ